MKKSERKKFIGGMLPSWRHKDVLDRCLNAGRLQPLNCGNSRVDSIMFT